MSVPAALPARAIRRIFCEDCERLCEAAAVTELRPGLGERLRGLLPSPPAVSLPSGSLPPPRGGIRPDLRWATLPLAGVAVFAVLSLVNGGDTPASPPADPVAAAKPQQAPAAKADAKSEKGGQAKTPVPADAQLVAESTFSLALPAGWDRVKPAAGATFAAVSPDGAADATLWIQSDPKLDFATFEANSLEQLETLTGSARVVERNIGPSPAASSITLAPQNAPSGSPTYEVVLRAAGDNWYYLATTHQAGAPADSIKAVELIQGTFLPLGGKP
ncbi:MAG: hypothetical protein M3Y34_07745 [Actinomycetota bacterium]|nr:hypothetical protein [Actinomycetota bacterium]